MFKPYHFENRFVGYSYETPNRFYFFGGRGFTRADLPRAFPQYEFSFLKQIHSAKVVPSDLTQEPEADAVFTAQENVAVIAQSADCTPILLSSKDTVCAIHSGWRGVAQNIVAAVKTRLPDFDLQFAAVGPHILRESFEVDEDVAEQLDRARPDSKSYSEVTGPGKRHYDLNALVEAQLRAAFPTKFELETCLFDTKTDPRFCSYRRDAREAGRQYSFVVIKTQKPGSIPK